MSAETTYLAALRLRDHLVINIGADSLCVALPEPRHMVVEKVVHELAHALLVGTPLVAEPGVLPTLPLSTRIANDVAALPSRCEMDRNEVESAVVTFAVLCGAGVEVHETDVWTSIGQQIEDAFWLEAEQIWKTFPVTERCRAVVQKIHEMLEAS